MNFYDFSAKDINGNNVDMQEYKGKVILVVNTATKCGLSGQLKDLQELYTEFKEKNVEILGFPCNQFANQEPGDNSDIQNVCMINYGVTFKMFDKINVNGENAHPIYKYLKEQKGGILSKGIKWNFTKFLIDQEGNVVDRYAPTVKPVKIKKDIENLIK